jgi:hypothetical protein
LRDGIQRPYPTALAGSIAAAALVAIVGYVWFKSLSLWEREPRQPG